MWLRVGLCSAVVALPTATVEASSAPDRLNGPVSTFVVDTIPVLGDGEDDGGERWLSFVDQLEDWLLDADVSGALGARRLQVIVAEAADIEGTTVGPVLVSTREETEAFIASLRDVDPVGPEARSRSPKGLGYSYAKPRLALDAIRAPLGSWSAAAASLPQSRLCLMMGENIDIYDNGFAMRDYSGVRGLDLTDTEMDVRLKQLQRDDLLHSASIFWTFQEDHAAYADRDPAEIEDLRLMQESGWDSLLEAGDRHAVQREYDGTLDTITDADAAPCFGDTVTVEALEVTQGLQSPDNQVTLIARRDTLARAYLTTGSPAGVDEVPVTLVARRNGVELDGEPLYPATGEDPLLGDDAFAGRTDITSREGTAPFLVPDEWVAQPGPLELEIRAGQPLVCGEGMTRDAQTGGCVQEVMLAAATELNLAVLQVSHQIPVKGAGPKSRRQRVTPTEAGSRELARRVERALPLSRVNATIIAADAGVLPMYNGHPSTSDLLAAYRKHRADPRRTPGDPALALALQNAHVVLIHATGASPDDTIGQAKGTSVALYDQGVTEIDSPGYNRMAVAHEIGHALGLAHAVTPYRRAAGRYRAGPCGEILGTSNRTLTPLDHVFERIDGHLRPLLGPRTGVPARAVIHGLDTDLARLALDPATSSHENAVLATMPVDEVFALMSYCRTTPRGAWTAKVEYDALLARLPVVPDGS